MWPLLRIARASLLFAGILLSYLVQLALDRLLGRKRVGERWKRVHRKNARRLYRGMVRMRGIYIKLGQILSIMGTFLPRAYSEELEGLQDQVPPRSFREIEAAFTRSLGKRPSEVFELLRIKRNQDILIAQPGSHRR